MQIKKIIKLIDQISPKLILLFCHNNADPDSLCSAFAFKELLARLYPKIETKISTPLGPSRLSMIILPIIPIEFTNEPNVNDADLIILFDTNTIKQIAEFENGFPLNIPLIIIDHHVIHPETEQLASIYLNNEKATSTCEIVYHLFKEAKILISAKVAKALFLGIAFDTRHFVLATSDAIKIIADLVDIGINVQEILPLLSLPLDHSERIARLKASSRIKLLKIKSWIIVLSHVTSYQASAARALLALGAHVSIVVGKRGKNLQVSMRASNEFHKKTGIHMGRDIAIPLGEFLGGMGGGHTVSAGANGFGNVNDCLKFSRDLLKNKLL